MTCPECGSTNVTTTPGTLPVCRDCDWTGWEQNAASPRLEYLRSQIKAERISYSELAELQSLADKIDPHDVELLEWAGVSEEEAMARVGALPGTRLCAGPHTWLLIRRYTGIEDFDVKSVIDAETGDEIALDSLQPTERRPINLVVSDDRNSDSYDGVQEEYLECKYCPAQIMGDIVGDIEQ
jgi:hypothetical protein